MGDSTTASQVSLDPLKPPTPPEPPPEGEAVPGLCTRTCSLIPAMRAPPSCCFLTCYDSDHLMEDPGGVPEQWTVQVTTCCRTTTMTITTSPSRRLSNTGYASPQCTHIYGINPGHNSSDVEYETKSTYATPTYILPDPATPALGTHLNEPPISGSPSGGTPVQTTPIHTPPQRCIVSIRRREVRFHNWSINITW